MVGCANRMGYEYEKAFKKIWPAIQKALVIPKGLAIGRGDNDVHSKISLLWQLLENY